MFSIKKEVSPFTYDDSNAFGGTTPFEDGSSPLSFIVEDGETTIFTLAGNNGVEVVIIDENKEDSVSLFNNDFNEEKYLPYNPSFNRKEAILYSFNTVVDLIKDSIKENANPYKELLFSLDGFSLAIG